MTMINSLKQDRAPNKANKFVESYPGQMKARFQT
jgi:hypothetical protein